MRFLFDSLSDRPAARAVALFGALNLGMVLLYVIFAPSRLEPAGFVAWRHPPSVVLRVALAALVYGVIVWAVRPGRRTRRELTLLAGIGVAFTALLSVAYLPFAPLAVVPIVARYWLGLRRTALLSLTALLLTAPLWQAAFASTSDVPVAAFVGVLLVTIVLNGYTLGSFEFALRESRAREELSALRDLEVRHAELAERARISRELHDTLGHHLTAQRFDLQLLGAHTTDAGRPALDRATARNVDALADVRRAVRALRPETLAGRVTTAVTDLAALWPSEVTLQLRGDEPRLDADEKLAVYRFVQEALTNARRHAEGAPVHLTLAFDDAVTVEASNAAAAHTVTAGSGLRGLAERAATLGGRIDVYLAEGRFTVRLSWPLGREERA